MKTIFINRLSFAFSAILFVIVLYSCQKENSLSDPVTEEQAATYSEESSSAEASFDDVDDVAMTAADEENNASEYGINGRGFFPSFVELRASIGDCANITVSPNDSTYPKTITIDFGDSCVGRDGKLRSGAIILHFTAPLRRPGSVVTITFRNFYLNHVHLEGTKIFSNLSDPPVHKWSVQVVGGKVTFPSGRGYSYESLKYKKQIGGMDTRIVRDDVYTIEGRSKTEFNGGLTITLNTETPLVKKVACPWISDGKLKIKINARVFFLDYGFPNDGQCDNKALLTWNDGNSQRVILLP
ncbi:MAG: hypothetical protein EPN92_02805 [Chitinophagaceae bacterium]|nr:MAG: hypothetical protein EPN92_02805 [Chitinophagaceae bacterium]